MPPVSASFVPLWAGGPRRVPPACSERPKISDGSPRSADGKPPGRRQQDVRVRKGGCGALDWLQQPAQFCLGLLLDVDRHAPLPQCCVCAGQNDPVTFWSNHLCLLTRLSPASACPPR